MSLADDVIRRVSHPNTFCKGKTFVGRIVIYMPRKSKYAIPEEKRA